MSKWRIQTPQEIEAEMEQNKLNDSITEYELLKRLDNEFDDLEYEFSYTHNEGGKFIVYFKEKKENE